MNDLAHAGWMPMSPEQAAVLARWPEDGLAHAAQPGPPLEVAIDGPVDVARLHAAAQSAVQRHEALQLAISQVPGRRGAQQMSCVRPLSWHEGSLPATALDLAGGEAVRVALRSTAPEGFVLSLAASPLVADQASLRVLLADIESAYAGASPAPAEVLQYGQFVQWRQELAGSDDAAAGQAYWARWLQDAAHLPALRLPYHQRQPRADAAVSRHERRLVVPLVGDDVGLSAQAAWWLLLARLNDWQAFVGGWRNDCRADYPPMQGAVGVFGKTLPVRVDPAPHERFDQWRQRLAASLATHVEAQEFWDIVTPPLSAPCEAVFSVEAEAPHPAGWRAAARGDGGSLSVHVQAGRHGIEIVVAGDGARYGAAAIDTLARQYAVLLQAALLAPATTMARLPMADAAERQFSLSQAGPALALSHTSLSQCIASHAQRDPRAPALEMGALRLDYGQLQARVDRLAASLAARGVMPGSLVALSLPRSAELVLAMLAVWRAGAAYLPLEPEWPAARRQALLQDARPVLVLESIEHDDAAAATAIEPAPQDLAYVLYTSGSTGTPKGVAISHGALLNYVAAASQAMQLHQRRRFALTSSVVADLGNTTLFGALYLGACLVVASHEESTDAAQFADFLARTVVDAIKIVPSHLEALLEAAPAQLPDTIILGGEPATPALLARLRGLAPQAVLYNHYGPTETTVGVLVHRIDDALETPPLSTVLANNHVYVLDQDLQPVAAGVPGELCIGGAQLFSGYVGRDAGQVLVADPHRPGARLYRTGDRAVLRPGGGLALLGRADHQVKIRGFRVDPAEVEQALASLAGVRQAVVLAGADANGAMALKACVVLDANAQLPSLREQLASLLPAAMLPADYAVLAELPRLPNGKVDRAALAALPTAAPAAAGRAPTDALEQVLARGMGMALGCEIAHVDEDFFDLGAHSLVVIKFVARLRKLLEVELAPALVFDHPTVASLAAALRGQSGLAERAERLWQEQGAAT